MRSMRDKYENDPQYSQCVKIMENMIHNNQFTPSEMREMAVLACIHYEMSRPMPSIILRHDCEMALRVLQEIREKNITCRSDPANQPLDEDAQKAGHPSA